jgi:hypothetical protein
MAGVGFDPVPWVEGVGAMDRGLWLVSISLLVVGMIAGSWVAVRCGFRAPIEKERGNGKEG